MRNAFLSNWKEEKQSAYLYLLIANTETDPIRKKLFQELAGVAEKQASLWAKKMIPETERVLEYSPDVRTRLVGFLLTHLGAKQIRFILSAMKVRGMSIYAGAPSSHAAASQIEHRHKGINTAGNLRAAVFGVNDGLISNMSLLLGVVGGNANHSIVVLTGIAGLLAGACSMAAGEYVSMRSQQEFFEYQIQLEKEELDLYPEEEAAELACIYRARGLPEEEAKKLGDLMISHPKTALDALAREELGLNPDELGSPMGAALFSFISFSVGALVPLLPFLLGERDSNVWQSGLMTGIALMAVGMLLSLFTSRSAIWSGFRMLLIGSIAGLLTFGIGKLAGVALG